MLRFEHLTTGYADTVIGQHLQGHLPAASLTALLGANGCGKSTLLRTLARFQKPIAWQAGSSLQLCGKPLADYSPRQLAQHLSIVLTHKVEAEALTAGEVIATGRIPYSTWRSSLSAADQSAISQAISLTHTDHLQHRPIATLSDGERQRIFIAKALAQSTPVILLDEPTAFLDFGAKVRLMRLLSDLAHLENKTILLSTHDVELALRFADQLWLLHADHITAGSPRTLADNGSLAHFFQSSDVDFDASTMRFLY